MTKNLKDKKRKTIPSDGSLRDMSSMNEQHIENRDTALKMFREFPTFQLKDLLILPTVICIAKYFYLEGFLLTILLSPFLIILILQLTTHILIEYKKLKLVYRTNIFR